MINDYLEPIKKVEINKANNELIEDAINLKNQIENHIEYFSKFLKSLKETNLIKNKNRIENFTHVFAKELDVSIQSYNLQRENIFKNIRCLPEPLTESFYIDKEKSVFKGVDSLGMLSDYNKINRNKLESYIEENNVAVFPFDLLNADVLNPEIMSVVEKAKENNKGKEVFIVGTISNIDLNKILNGKKLDLSKCMFSKEDKTIIQSFLFQLPLLQGLNDEIKNLTNNANKVKEKINNLKDTFESFVDNQIDYNTLLGNKVTEIIRNVNYFNKIDFERREAERMRNPYCWVTDYDRLEETWVIDREKTSEEMTNSDYEDGYVYKKAYYHPLKQVLRPRSEEMYVSHLQTSLAPKMPKEIKDLTYDSVKKIIKEEIKNNFVCILSKDISSITEKSDVVFTFGKGFSPVSDLVLEGDFKEVKVDKKGLKA